MTEQEQAVENARQAVAEVLAILEEEQAAWKEEKAAADRRRSIQERRQEIERRACKYLGNPLLPPTKAFRIGNKLIFPTISETFEGKCSIFSVPADEIR